MVKTPGLVLASLAVVAVIALVAMLLRESGARQTGVPDLRTGVALAPPVVLPDFSLSDQRGRPFTAASLRGHWSLVVPGFTYCPDICPTTLATLDRVHTQLAADASPLQVVLLTVDPERDSTEVLARYLAFFNPAFIGVTGAPAQLEQLYQVLGVQRIRIPGAQGAYSVDHSAALLLVDPGGRLAGYFMPPFSAERLTADLGPLLAAGQ